jgi:hypothetical protein
MLHEGFLPLMISKEEEVADPIKKKWVDSSTIDSKQTKHNVKIYTKSIKLDK